MILSKSKDRKVEITEGEGGFLLSERVRYVPRGYTKAKWDESRVWLSLEEFAKLERGYWPPKGSAK
jgi:hypothetical protein